MKKKTDLDAVKREARTFLYLEPRLKGGNVYSLRLVHPVFEDMNVEVEGQDAPINILESQEKFIIAAKPIDSRILAATSAWQIAYIIKKPWRLLFLKHIEKYLSQEDLAELLADIWVGSENPNEGTTCTISQLTKFFKRANKKVLMDEEDYIVFTNLEPEFTVYRGVTDKGNPNGLSWTLDYDKAVWFANRFAFLNEKSGYVLSAKAKKEDVIAYFNTRNEKEIIINPKNLMDIRKI